MGICQGGEGGDVADGEPIAVAEEEVGVQDVDGIEVAVGGDVENAVTIEVFEDITGEFGVEMFFAGIETVGILVLGDDVEFVGDVV